MTRVKRGLVSRRKHKKLLGLTKGYRGTRSKLVKMAHEAALHAGEYAFHGRKRKKRDMRTLWIVRISEAAKLNGTTYSRLINNLKNANILLDRKVLSDLVLNDNETFKKVVAEATK